nr:unnamed protein product [Digitaria exilis]
MQLSMGADDDAAAFIDAATGGSLSFSGLRRAALSLASGLRLGLGLRRGDTVLVVSRNSLLLPQILVGVLAAGGVVVAADPDATAPEIAAAAAHATMVVADAPLGFAGDVGVPLLLTSRSLDPRGPLLSAEELIDGGDPTEAHAHLPEPDADVVAAISSGGGRRVCVTSLPMCSADGLALIAMGLPAAGVTTVLLDPSDEGALREAVAKHAATDVVAAPEAAATLLAAGPGASLASLRRVLIVAPTPLTPEARHQFRRRLPWVHVTELPTQTTAAAAGTHNSQQQPAQQTNEVPSLKKIQKIVLGDIFSRSTAPRIFRNHLATGNTQAVSKL